MIAQNPLTAPLAHLVGNGRFDVCAASCTIGSEVGNSIVLREKTVSRRHALLLYKQGFFELTDLDSTNGTFVNGLRVNRSQFLSGGDRVAFGSAEFTFAIEPAYAKPIKPQRGVHHPKAGPFGMYLYRILGSIVATTVILLIYNVSPSFLTSEEISCSSQATKTLLLRVLNSSDSGESGICGSFVNALNMTDESPELASSTAGDYHKCRAQIVTVPPEGGPQYKIRVDYQVWRQGDDKEYVKVPSLPTFLDCLNRG
jgi:pSer/pThr/pTyr-binding forkhead associated (FHA) protein